MPDSFARYLGIPEQDAGEGTVWRILWETPWPGWLPDWVGWLMLVGVWLAVMFVLSCDARHASFRGRCGLMTLRSLIVFLLMFLLFQPVLSVNRTIKPVLALLIDQSQSMSLKDDPGANEGIANSAADSSRLERAQDVLLESDARLLREFLLAYKIRAYAFSESASFIGQADADSPEQLEQLISAIGQLEPTGELTQPGPAIGQVLSDMKSAPPSSIVLFSDGIATGQTGPKSGAVSEALAPLKKNGVSLWSVGIGSEQPARDVKLLEVRAPEAAFQGDPIRFETLFDQTGCPDTSATLQLALRDSPQVLAEQPVTLKETNEPQSVTLEWQPDRTGELDFEIRILPLEAEVDTQNNMLPRTVYVRDQPLRVLLAERAPRYEYRYLKHFLEREKSVQLDTVLFEGDRRYALQDRSGQALGGRFPVRADQLFAYDVILLGDVAPDDLGPGVLNLLVQFVEEQGKSLILIAGRRFNPAAYRNTPLETLFPVGIEPVPFTIPSRWKSDGFQPQPTPAGLQGTPAFQWSGNQTEQLAFWESLPAWFHVFPWPELKSGAIVWLQTESAESRLPQLPLISEQRYGAGKVLFHATDELWRLRFLREDRNYGKYWLQTLRYLTRSSAEAGDIDLSTDRKIYDQGDQVTVRLRQPQTGSATLPQISVTGPRTFERNLSAETGHPELFTAQLDSLPEGSYRVEYRPTSATNVIATEFRVQPGRRELTERSLNRTELTEVAKKSGGRFLTVDGARKLPELLPPGRKILLESLDPLPLWSRWELFALVLTLLTVEWLLRKRLQML